MKDQKLWAAIGGGSVTSLIALTNALGTQPWWVTVSLIVSWTILGVTYMVTTTWAQRPAPAGTKTPESSRRPDAPER